MTSYEKVMREFAKLTDEQFTNFLENHSEYEKEMFNQMRFWGKMKTDKEFYKKVEQATAEATYATANL